MKNFLIFCGGVFTGVVLTFLFALIVLANSPNSSITLFENAGEVVDVKTFEVFQVIDDGALVYRKSKYRLYSGMLYYLINDDGEYYYDGEIIQVPKGKVVRQIGIFQYKTLSEFGKTVPVIQIMDK